MTDPTPVPCYSCLGTGEAQVMCPECMGDGFVERGCRARGCLGGACPHEPAYAECRRCDGDGTILGECPDCMGTGEEDAF